MAKWHFSETAVQIASGVVKALGGYGYVREYPVECYLGDARLMTTGEKISKVQRLHSAGPTLGRIGA